MKSLLTLLFLGLSTLAHASLSYDFTKKTIDCDPSDDLINVEFHFKNTGTKTITISDIETTCGCLKGKADKYTLQPGESGKIESQFKIGSLTGNVAKPIYVHTDDRDNPKQQLVVELKIPKIVEFIPQSVRWNTSEPAKPKAFRYKVLRDTPIHIKEIASSRNNVTVELKTIKPGWEYEIVVTPDSTKSTLLGFVKVTTDCEIKKHQNQMLFFVIAPPKK